MRGISFDRTRSSTLHLNLKHCQWEYRGDEMQRIPYLAQTVRPSWSIGYIAAWGSRRRKVGGTEKTIVGTFITECY